SSAHAEAIGHLKLALELLQSLPEGPEHKRKALELQVMLAQAMIAGRRPTTSPVRSRRSRKRRWNFLPKQSAMMTPLHAVCPIAPSAPPTCRWVNSPPGGNTSNTLGSYTIPSTILNPSTSTVRTSERPP